jgi:hypothetical protein
MKSLPAAVAIMAAVLAPLAFANWAHADCSYPQAPDHLPDGNTATLNEMLAGQKAVQSYNERMMAYLSCIKLERDNTMAQAAGKLSKQQQAAIEAIEIQKHNAAVDQLQSVANQFNTQVKIFKAKGKSSG